MSFRPPFQEPTTEQLLATLGLDKASLPFSDEAEKGVISSILQYPDDRIPEAKGLIPVAAFYHVATRTVFEAAVAMYDQSIPLDIGTLTHRLREMKNLDKVGGPAAVSEMFTYTAVSGLWGYFVAILLDKHHLRRQIHADAQNILAAMAHDRTGGGIPASTLLDAAEARIRSVRDGTQGGEFRPLSEDLLDVADDIEEQIRKHELLQLSGEVALPGISTGLAAIDERTGGYCSGHVHLVQASTNDGKTTWAIQQGLELALGPSKTPFVHYLTEGSKADFLKKLVAHVTRIDLSKILRGNLDQGERRRITAAMVELSASCFILRHKPGMTKREILADMRVLHRKHAKVQKSKNEPGIVFCFDYLQRIKGRERGQEKHEHIADTSAAITDLTGTLGKTGPGACSIVLSQLASGDGKTAGNKDVGSDMALEMTISCPPMIDEKTGRPMTKTGRDGQEIIRVMDEDRSLITFGKGRVMRRGGQPVTLAFNGAIQRFS